ncbi:hypothetical protein D3C79_927750 [compost metagenome]
MLLISAIPPAALAGFNSAGGMVQNSGTAESDADAPRVSSASDSTAWPLIKPSSRKQIAATSKVRLRCQRRSMWRSELRPIRYMPHRPPRKGRLLTRPIECKSSRPKPLISVGIQ